MVKRKMQPVPNDDVWPEEGAVVGAEHIQSGVMIRRDGQWKEIVWRQAPNKKGTSYIRCDDGTEYVFHAGATVRVKPAAADA